MRESLTNDICPGKVSLQASKDRPQVYEGDIVFQQDSVRGVHKYWVDGIFTRAHQALVPVLASQTYLLSARISCC